MFWKRMCRCKCVVCMCVSDITSPSAIASGAQGMLALNVQARLHRLVYLCMSLCVLGCACVAQAGFLIFFFAWVRSLATFREVVGNQLVVSDSLFIDDTFVYVWCGWLLWLGTLKAGTSKQCEACSLIINTKWWTVMLRLCSDVWSATCEQGISIYELLVELCSRKMVWNWYENSLKRSKMGSKYALYVVKMSRVRGLWKRLWDQQPSLMTSRWSQGRFA